MTIQQYKKDIKLPRLNSIQGKTFFCQSETFISDWLTKYCKLLALLAFKNEKELKKKVTIKCEQKNEIKYYERKESR